MDIPKSRAENAYALLNDVISAIREEPLRIHMDFVCFRGESLIKSARHLTAPSCNTVGCVAGWVLVLRGCTTENEYNGGATRQAREILGLNEHQEQQLFYPRHLLFSPDPTLRPQTQRYAEAVIDHIRDFQADYKFQLTNKRIIW